MALENVAVRLVTGVFLGLGETVDRLWTTGATLPLAQATEAETAPALLPHKSSKPEPFTVNW